MSEMTILVGCVYLLSITFGCLTSFLPKTNQLLWGKIQRILDKALSTDNDNPKKTIEMNWIDIFKHNTYLFLIFLVMIEYNTWAKPMVFLFTWIVITLNGLILGMAMINLGRMEWMLTFKEKIWHFSACLLPHGIFEISGFICLNAIVLSLSTGTKPTSLSLGSSLLLMLIAAFVEEKLTPKVVRLFTSEKIQRINQN